MCWQSWTLKLPVRYLSSRGVSSDRVPHGLYLCALAFGDVDIVKNDYIILEKFNRLHEIGKVPMKDVSIRQV